MDTLVSLLETPGFSALTALFGVAIGYLLQPLAARRIRSHEDEERWRERGREVAADIDGFLRRMSFDIGHEVSQEASKSWLRDMERPLLMLGRFYPDETVRVVARALWVECRLASNRTLAFPNTSDPDTRLRLSERQKEDVGEASFALDKLVELLGGEAARKREEIDYTLRSDRKSTFKQAWE